MDKQQLLKRFQTNYLSRQDVLFKLPLNISIDTFWPELLSWRKSRATRLPLYNAYGQPYWFVTTDKMVRASERLCTEALDRDDDFDPYRIQMTQELSTALTQESYYTSFVEGADYTLEDAIAFLRRGTEPENVYEQNYLNNYQALSYLLSALSVPIDERYVKDLTFILTDGQVSTDGQNVSYRTEDTAPIPAMEGEAYAVPAAFTIPNLMSQLYAFLADTKIHPLIKAAVSQAFILTTRPFPEGNDRLARIISSAVLLRCGYEFFLDISISSHIAKENYRYFKAMKEIIRAENEGDLTYFVEYYLTLLVRALDNAQAEHAESERQAEHQMAMQPLAPSPPAPVAPVFSSQAVSPAFNPSMNQMNEAVMEQPPAIQFMTPEMMQSMLIKPPEEADQLPEGAVQLPEAFPPQGEGFGLPPQEGLFPSQQAGYSSKGDIEALIANSVSLEAFADGAQPTSSFRAAQSQAGSTQADTTVLKEAPSTAAVDTAVEEYRTVLQDIAHLFPVDNFVQKMIMILSMGIEKFTSIEWGEINLLNEEEAMIECDILYRGGILDRYLRHGRFVYLFRFENKEELAQMVREGRIIKPQVTGSPEGELFWSKLAIMESSISDTLRRGAGIVRDMIREGIQEFSKDDWIERTGMAENEYTSCRNKMTDLGLIVNLANPDGVNTRRPGLFRFTSAFQPQAHLQAQTQSQVDARFQATVQSQDDPQFQAAVQSQATVGEEEGDTTGDMKGAAKVSTADITWSHPRQPISAQEMLGLITANGDSARALRIRDYLQPRLNGQSDTFTAQDWEQHFQISRTMAEKDIRKALNLGLLTRNEDCATGELHKYKLVRNRLSQVVSYGLGDFKKDQVFSLYQHFGKNPFSTDDFADMLDLKPNSVSYRIEEYVDRGYILPGRYGNRAYYRLAVSPESNPECFRHEETEKTAVMMATV